MSMIEQNLQRVHLKMRTAARDFIRDPNTITLLAVSKSQPVTAIQAAIEAGQREFGENYVQEGIGKIDWFRQRLQCTELIWHFIGPLQANKSRLVAEHFDWCHTLDRPQLARRLQDRRPAERGPLNVLIQINISGEPTKAGIVPAQMLPLATLITACPRLRLRGLMAIPAPKSDFYQHLLVFKRMYDLYQTLQRIHSCVDTLSLGMTDDMPAAIAAGSTLVRIGTAIFGTRT